MTVMDMFDETAGDSTLIKNVTHTGALRSISWTGEGRDGRQGWWWTVTYEGDADVLAFGWAPLSDVQRNADIAAAIVRVLYQAKPSVAS